ncbi:MAG: hypothetical protein KJ709_03570 [Nanoarchaeota archaeon]|nr:hypothetical protein [Nanoarchaeota archaeon]
MMIDTIKKSYFIMLSVTLVFFLFGCDDLIERCRGGRCINISVDCDTINDPYAEAQCFSFQALTVEDCNRIDPSVQRNSTYKSMPFLAIRNREIAFKDECVIRIAERSNQTSICEEHLESESRDFCYAAIAYRRRDIYLCDELIVSEDVKDFCRLKLDRYNPDWCSDETNMYLIEHHAAANWQDHCYDDAAKNRHDEEICRYIMNEPSRERCITFITDPISLCEIDDCYYNLAQSTGNDSICLEIDDEEKRISCLS